MTIDAGTIGFLALALSVAGVIFQAGRLSARVDGHDRDISALTAALQRLTRDVHRLHPVQFSSEE